MARALRDALKAKAVEITHSESLELGREGVRLRQLEHLVNQDRSQHAKHSLCVC
jgi:hypothetical protein